MIKVRGSYNLILEEKLQYDKHLRKRLKTICGSNGARDVAVACEQWSWGGNRFQPVKPREPAGTSGCLCRAFYSFILRLQLQTYLPTVAQPGGGQAGICPPPWAFGKL